jgi:Recombination endonuclease VII
MTPVNPSTVRTRKWRAANPERYRKSEKNRRLKNRDAIKASQRQWYAANRDGVMKKVARWRSNNLDVARKHSREAARRYRAANRERHRKYADDYRLKITYSLTREQYDAKLAAQNNLCAMCHEPFDASVRGPLAPVLDHDHKTGKVREFLHNKCNRGMGYFDDDLERILQAATYMQRHGEK